MTSYIYLALIQTWKILSEKRVCLFFALCYSSFFPYFSLLNLTFFTSFVIAYPFPVTQFCSVGFLLLTFISVTVFWIPQGTHVPLSAKCHLLSSTMYISTEYKYIIQTRKTKVPLRQRKDIFCSVFHPGKERAKVSRDLFKICTQLQVNSLEMQITIL